MFQRPSTCLLIALTGAALLAGCGGGSSKSTTSGSTGSTSTGTSSSISPAVRQLAVTTCQRTVQSELNLTSTAKAKLEAICNKASKGDAAEIRKVAQEVCVEIIKSSAGTSGAVKEKAIAACKSGK
jgi:hypothetical protein